MATGQPHDIYVFGEFELDARRRLLISRTEAAPVALTAKVFDALLYFVERPGELLDKRTLMEALWPHVVVEESNLTQTIHTLRRALGERPGEHRYIVTVPGRGYRFVADVQLKTDSPEPVEDAVVTPAPPGRPRRRWLLGFGALLLVMVAAIIVLFDLRGREPARTAAAQSPVLAVLPFTDMSAEGNQAYFADGLAEEILNSLTQSGELRVIARTSSFAFRDDRADISIIRKKLAVTHVLEGSVRKSGERVRVTAQLIDALSREHVWSRTYDHEVKDIFDVQTSIALAISEALHISLADPSQARRGDTRSAQAFEHYLQGRYFHTRRGPADLERARQSFKEAVRLDPHYARAWAGLASTYYGEIGINPDLKDVTAQWREAALQAVALGPDLAEAHMRAAQYYWWARDRDNALKHFDRAKELNPSDPLIIGSLMSRAVLGGRNDEAVVLAERLTEIDPLSAVARLNLGVMYLAAGHHRAAIPELERARELSPSQEFIGISLCKAHLLSRDYAAALAAVEGITVDYLRDQCKCLIYDATGDSAAAEQALERMKLAASNSRADQFIPLSIAEVYASRGQADAAFQWLDEAGRAAGVEGDDVSGEMFLQELQVSAMFRPLKDDSRWPRLLAAAVSHSRFIELQR